MKWYSKEEAQKDHIENYRSDNVMKQYGSPVQAHFHRVQFVIERVKPGSLVLDVGCNGGALGLPLINKDCYVKGVDIVEELVEKAKKRGIYAEKGEAEDLSRYDDNQFDYVLCTEVLEHLYDPTPAIKEAYRVLKPGGHYLVTVPHIHGLMAERNGDVYLGDYHQQNFTFEMLDTMFHSVFERGKVGHVDIPYPETHNISNGIQPIIKDGKKMYPPQWCGVDAEK